MHLHSWRSPKFHNATSCERQSFLKGDPRGAGILLCFSGPHKKGNYGELLNNLSSLACGSRERDFWDWIACSERFRSFSFTNSSVTEVILNLMTCVINHESHSFHRSVF